MENNWLNLYEKLLSTVRTQTISPFVKVGGTYCLIETNSKKNFIGTDINSSSFSASSIANAINIMLTNNEQNIEKIILINELGEIMTPALEMIEPILELNETYDNVSFLCSLNPVKTIKLSELIPDWWGTIKQK